MHHQTSSKRISFLAARILVSAQHLPEDGQTFQTRTSSRSARFGKDKTLTLLNLISLSKTLECKDREAENPARVRDYDTCRMFFWKLLTAE